MGADGVEAAYPTHQLGGDGAVPISALHFCLIKRDLFIEYNAKWHSRLPQFGRVPMRACYGAYHGDVLLAVAGWSNPTCRQHPQRTWLELRRLAIGPTAPKNTATRMLAWMRRALRIKFPEAVKLISYQDTDVHTGTIYRADNWHIPEGYKHVPANWANRPGRSLCATKHRVRWEYDLKSRT